MKKEAKKKPSDENSKKYLPLYLYRYKNGVKIQHPNEKNFKKINNSNNNS